MHVACVLIGWGQILGIGDHHWCAPGLAVVCGAHRTHRGWDIVAVSVGVISFGAHAADLRLDDYTAREGCGVAEELLRAAESS